MRRLLERTRLGRAGRRDAGFSLIELVVASGLGVVALLVIGGMMFSSFVSQQRVVDTAQATNAAQLAARAIEADLHRASALAVFDGDDSDSQLLVARTTQGDGDWNCQAWFYDDVGGVIFHTEFDGETTWPWGSDITNWIDLGSGLLEVVDVGTILGDTLDWLFGGGDDGASEWSVVATGIRDETGSADQARPVFTATGGKSVTIRYEVVAGDVDPVLITTTATGRQPDADTEPTCF